MLSLHTGSCKLQFFFWLMQVYFGFMLHHCKNIIKNQGNNHIQCLNFIQYELKEILQNAKTTLPVHKASASTVCSLESFRLKSGMI